VFNHVKSHCAKELKYFNRDLRIPETPFKRIEYMKAYEKYAGEFENILSYEHKDPFWIIDIPIDAREFYDREDPERFGILNDMDLVYPEGYGEALSGGEREHTYERIVYRLGRSGLPLANFEWYLEFAKRGLPPSAGFGIGIERMTRYVCGLKRIEEATLFPKTPGKLSL
jgi:asparaginyl-tRNA synthetase